MYVKKFDIPWVCIFICFFQEVYACFAISGGAIYCQGSNIIVRGPVKFLQNVAEDTGAAAYIGGGCSLVSKASILFDSNNATTYGGT